MNLKKSSLLLIAAAALCAAPAAVHADDYSSTDRQIQRDAKKNMPDAIADKIDIKSRDGIVTLTGTVDSEGQRRMAVDAVKQVPDVKDVDNEIVVNSGNGNVAMDEQEPADHHSDKWIAFKVKSSLLMHSDVSASHTDVNVEDGVVTLSGFAKTQAQKDLTAQYAREVEGVRDVRNQLQIRDESTFTGDQYQSNGKVDDSTITAKVKFQLAKHRSTSAVHTSVHTENGRVFISGKADNQAEKDLVTRLAKDTPGVRDVQNDMIVEQP